MPSSLEQYFSQRNIILLGLLLVLPSLWAGFYADDYWHYLWFHNPNHTPTDQPFSFLQFFTFHDGSEASRIYNISYSTMPWWADPSIKLNFWRPVSEVFHYIDHTLLASNPVLMHAHNLLWYSGILFLALKVYRIIHPESKVALWALLFFVTEPIHGFAVSWIANRNALIAATGALGVIIFHHQFRITTQYRFLCLSLLSAVFALFSAEIGMSYLAILFAYAVFIDKENRFHSLLWTLPAFFIFCIWFGTYQHLGYGAFGETDFYVSPTEEPLAFIMRFFERVPRILAMHYTLFSIFINDYHQYQLVAAIGYTLIIPTIVYAYYRKNIRLGFWLTASILACVPVLASPFQERNFLFIALFFSPILAIFIDDLMKWKQAKTRPASFLLAIVISLHVFIAGMLMPASVLLPKRLNQNTFELAQAIPESAEDKIVIAFGAPLGLVSFAYPLMQYHDMPAPLAIYDLSSETMGINVKLEDKNTLFISRNNGILFPKDSFIRDLNKVPFIPNQTIKLKHLSINILETNSRNNVTLMTVKLAPETLENMVLLSWTGAGFKEHQLDIGAEIHFEK